METTTAFEGRGPEEWTTSTYSGQQGDCVRWRQSRVGSGIEIGDSKDPHGPTLTVSPNAWAHLVELAKTCAI
jgi:hypothetical protein